MHRKLWLSLLAVCAALPAWAKPPAKAKKPAGPLKLYCAVTFWDEKALGGRESDGTAVNKELCEALRAAGFEVVAEQSQADALVLGTLKLRPGEGGLAGQAQVRVMRQRPTSGEFLATTLSQAEPTTATELARGLAPDLARQVNENAKR